MSCLDCRFCSIKNGIVKNEYDSPIMVGEDYFTLASVGSFIQGWSLIVPKEHVCSMREYYTDPVFLSFANEWIRSIEKKFRKKVILFEHGPNHFGSTTACGTEHGHLHVVPYNHSLKERIELEREWSYASYDQIKCVTGEEEYLLYGDFNESIELTDFRIHILRTEESQYFRRLLSMDFKGLDYNYKSNPLSKETIESYQLLKGLSK